MPGKFRLSVGFNSGVFLPLQEFDAFFLLSFSFVIEANIKPPDIIPIISKHVFKAPREGSVFKLLIREIRA